MFLKERERQRKKTTAAVSHLITDSNTNLVDQHMQEVTEEDYGKHEERGGEGGRRRRRTTGMGCLSANALSLARSLEY